MNKSNACFTRLPPLPPCFLCGNRIIGDAYMITNYEVPEPLAEFPEKTVCATCGLVTLAQFNLGLVRNRSFEFATLEHMQQNMMRKEITDFLRPQPPYMDLPDPDGAPPIVAAPKPKAAPSCKHKAQN